MIYEFYFSYKMASNGSGRLDEMAMQIEKICSEISELEREKIRLKAQREVMMQECEVRDGEAVELERMIEDVRCMHTNARMRNDELRRELEELRSKL